MSTNLTLSTTKERHTIAGVEHVMEKTFSSAGDIRLTLELDLSTLKSKESLQLQIEDLWKTFSRQALNLISGLSSSATIGPHPNTLSDIPIGQPTTVVAQWWGSPCQNPGCPSNCYSINYKPYCCAWCRTYGENHD